MTDTRIHPSELQDRSEPAWAGALWVGPDPSDRAAGPGGPATMLRREFVVDRAVSRARVRVYGLGLYELRLDGAKVGDLQLAPINGDYATNNVYDELDVQGPIEEGTHVLGLWLGDGYGASFNRFGFRWLGPRQAIVHLELFGPDGSVRHVISDLDWRWSTGAIVSSDLYDGEHHDATREQVGWDRAGFDASNWRPVVALPPASPSLVSNNCPRIRIVQTIPARVVNQPAPGVHVFDLGQNISGWPRLRVTGPRGTTVRMRMAEELDQDGFLDTLTNRDAVACNTYTLAGNGEEVYEPRFTYHGFRYIEVTGLPATPTAASITGRVVHADLVERGTFSCSDELLNQIWENHRWSIRTNSMGMPTDTPVRDERTPPAMDVQAYADAAVLNFEMADYYLKYLEDLPPGRPLPNDDHHAQQPDMAGGQVCLPWTLYHYYGDDRALRRHFPAMARFVDRNAALRPDHVWSDDAGFGDWCPPDPRAVASAGIDSPAEGRDNGSERALVNTALAFRQATTVAEAAAVLGLTEEANRYATLAAAIARAFHRAFARPDGRGYGSGRQTTSILPLAFGLVPEHQRNAVGEQLVNSILSDHHGHLDTGIFGTRYLLDALAAVDRVDVALTVLRQRTFPGFGFQIKHGATTAWEQWSYRAGMQTHNHAMFTGISASFYTQLAGLRPAAPGFTAVTIAPTVPDGLDWVRATLLTSRGPVRSAWQRIGTGLELDIAVPDDVRATVVVPLRGDCEVTATGAARVTLGEPNVVFVEGGTSVVSVTPRASSAAR